MPYIIHVPVVREIRSKDNIFKFDFSDLFFFTRLLMLLQSSMWFKHSLACVTFTDLSNDCFTWVKIKVKAQNSIRPWITKGILKSSKKKQKTYEKPLKNQNP